jgi:NDP-sugar pyrophosphorylase family protein
MIPALVLTAGLATRLRPLSLVRAKAAFPVAGESLIHRILRSLAAADVTDVVLNLHYLPHTLTGLLGDGADIGMRVRYSWEIPLLGSAGGPRRAIPIVGASTFLIVNGDTLANMDVRALIAHHARSGALVTMAVVPNTKPDKYGGVLASEDGIVTGFVRRGTPQPSYHFTFAQVVEAAAFEGVPLDTPYESVGALYPALIAKKPGSVRVFHSNAEYHDIGTPSDYLETSLQLAEREGPGATVGRGTRIDPAAHIERSILWDDVVVEAGAMLRECVITDGVRVPADTSWHGVVMRRADGELDPGEKQIEDLAVASI